MKRDYKYDIFISYKHEKLDKAVAAKLQKKLENYKIPKEIKVKTGKEKIQRVFRDEEELSISSDLGREIEEQIKQSEYLLLVCSKKTKESPWVLREVETFLKYRDAYHILPVLVDGEPEEAFPEILLQYGEPLAADIREKDAKSVLRKANKELPRILAPVLHCSYDELKQRHKVHQTYRLLGMGGIVLCIAMAFTAYALLQAQKLKKENQATRKNQARYLCTVSDSLLKSGDRIGALQTAMAILPEDENAKEPVVPEQMNALNNAMYSYKHDDLLYFRAERMEETKGDIQGKVKFSEKGNYCVAVDANKSAYFFDGKTGKLLWKAESESLTNEKTGIYAAAPLDENTAVLVTDTKLVTVDIKGKQQQNTCDSHFEKNYTNSEINLFIIQNKAVLWDGGQVCITDLKSGEKLYYHKNEDNNIEQVIADEKGERLFIAVGEEMELEKEDGTGNLVYTEKNSKDGAGIYCYTLKEKKMDRISTRATEKMCLIDNYIAAVQYTDYRYIDMFTSEAAYSLSVYNVDTGKRVWKQNGLKEDGTHAKADCQSFDIKQNKKKKQKIIIFYFQNTLYCLDADTHKMLSQKSYDSSIAGIGQYDGVRLLVCLEDGSIYYYRGDSEESYYSKVTESQMNVGGIESDFIVDSFSYNVKNQTAIEYGDEKIAFLRMLQDDKVKVLNEEDELSKVFYITVKEKKKNTVYRCMSFNKYNNDEVNKVVIYKSGESRPIYTIQAPDKEKTITNVTIGLQDSKLVVCYSINPEVSFDSDEKAQFYMIDLETKQTLNRYEISQVDYATEGHIVYTENLSYAWLYDNEHVWKISLTPYKMKVKGEKQWTLKNDNWQTTTYIWKVTTTADDKYILFTYCQNSAGSSLEYYLKIWDRKNSKWKKIDGKKKIAKLQNENAVTEGQKTNVIAVEKKGGNILLVNLDKGSIENIITSYKENETIEVYYTDMAFFNNDKYLIKVRRDEGYLNVLDIRSGEILAEVKDKLIGTHIIVDDNLEYFGVKDDYVGKTSNSILTQKLTIYKFEEQDQALIKYADVDYGWGSFEGKEIIGGNDYNLTYYTDFYDFSQLRKEAEELLKGETLTKKEKRKYFLEDD